MHAGDELHVRSSAVAAVVTAIIAGATVSLVPSSRAEPCFIGIGSEGLAVGIGDDVDSGSDGPEFWCEHRFAHCGGIYADVNESGFDSFLCHRLANLESEDAK